MPKISVIMSVYNGERHLAESIQSILDQTYTDFEFLIVDDGSNDSTQRIISGYNDSRIRLIRNKMNIGLTKSLNLALARALGKYIARQDAGDISLPDRFKQQVRIMERGAKVATCSYEIIDHNERKLQTVLLRKHDVKKIKKALKYHNIMAHGTLMIDRDALVGIGGYRELFRYAQDYDLVLRLVQKYKIHMSPHILYKYRHDKDSISIRHMLDQNRCAALARVLANQEHRNRYEKIVLRPNQGFILPKSILPDYYHILGVRLTRRLKSRIARKYLVRAIALDPVNLSNYSYLFASFGLIRMIKRVRGSP